MTTHVFIVTEQSFRVHLEYMFVGTGAKDKDNQDKDVDFNGVASSNLKPQTENGLISMMSDFSRVRIGDYVLFYVQSLGKKDGKFYGIYQINSTPFHEPSSKNQYLCNSLGKNLTFRALIKPYKVYAEGVTEWEALDEIKGINAPNQMQWSLIYRKLKGNRGNTMITIYEAERLFNLIKTRNNNSTIFGNSYSYDDDKQVALNTPQKQYTGNIQAHFNILPRLIYKKYNKKAFEAHLQMFVVQNICNHNSLDNALKINHKGFEWLGNEVSCGVGMQRIDIMFSQNIDDIEREVVPVELKDESANVDNVKQLSRYIKWIEQYYISNRPSTIRPVLICRASGLRDVTKQAFHKFNDEYKGRCLPLEYIEFTDNGTDLIFTNTPY